MIPLATVLRSWGRIGVLGFGGPPAHIRMLRDLTVEREGWLAADEFEDAVATCNLLPGPSSTQLAIYTSWRVAGVRGALVGGLSFILPGLVIIVALAAVFVSGEPPHWVLALGAGAGAAVPAVAVAAGWSLAPSSWARTVSRARWVGYLLAGVASPPLIGAWVVVVLLGCGAIELMMQQAPAMRAWWDRTRHGVAPPLALLWLGFKVGALSYGGGFVIIPLMQTDAVTHHGWMSGEQFLHAVALGQITPGPVTHTVAVVGYAAGGLGGALLADVVAFAPSFLFVLLGGRHFDRIRAWRPARAVLDGAGPAAIGAILGSAIVLGRALESPWQLGVLAGALVLLLALRRGVVATLLLAAAAGLLLS